MKNSLCLLLASAALAAINVSAQGMLNDSAIMGPGYANQVFYDVKTGAKATSAVNNWDMAHTSACNLVKFTYFLF